MQKPALKPQNPCFSSGPCAKRPGWSLEALSGAFTGRSHRAALPKARIRAVIDRHRALLGIPGDYLIGIVPASDTGAFEMALWSMLGARGVDVFAWESFSEGWLRDIVDHLRIGDVRSFTASYGAIPDLSQADPRRDIVFVWNGTTSGVRVPNADWIRADREGLTFCDATSAVFAYDMSWEKLDVTTWSWQKVLGGEAAHGMLVLSPRAVDRLENYDPGRPLPKIFRMLARGKINAGIFEGETINTPSMLAVEDCLDALNWLEGVGGLKVSMDRTQGNYAAIERWAAISDWAAFLAQNPAVRSATSVCLKIKDPWFLSLPHKMQETFISRMCTLLEQEEAAFDIKHYRDAPPGLRIWCGATVETADVEALLPWLDWAFHACRSQAP